MIVQIPTENLVGKYKNSGNGGTTARKTHWLFLYLFLSNNYGGGGILFFYTQLTMMIFSF
jgi:hypothetical protein